jgi:hypothetical protein
MQDCSSAAYSSLPAKNVIKVLFYLAFPGVDLNPHERDGLGISSAFRPTLAASQCI